MGTRFVTVQDDRLGMHTIEHLRKRGYAVRALETTETALSTDVAFFTTSASIKFKKKPHFFVVTPHKFAQRGVVEPPWATATPFQVAIRPNALTYSQRSFEHALEQLAQTYTEWNPWITPSPAPWSPEWRGAIPEAFTNWYRKARAQIQPPSLTVRMQSYLPSVFKGSCIKEPSKLLIIGCAAFNKPHTDFVNELLPLKMRQVVAHLSTLITRTPFAGIEVVTVGGDILSHPAMRRHLHPFIFMSPKEVERAGTVPQYALLKPVDKNYRRRDDEIAASLETSGEAMRRQLIEPLQEKIGQPVTEVSWLPMVRTYLDEATRLAEEHKTLIASIYRQRVETRPSYKAMHHVDPHAGINRTIGNAVLYIAEAMYLRDHPEYVLANFEANDVYWRGLETLVQPIWREHTPYIGMAPEALRQPWGY